MTTSSALVIRLSVCRKRIMDGLLPSTLYARTRRVSEYGTEQAVMGHIPRMRNSRDFLDYAIFVIIDETEPAEFFQAQTLG